MYGRAFRAPSFGELHFQNNPLTIGNPYIKPETIDTYEIAFDYQPSSRLRTMLNLFTYEIDGLIEYVPDPAPATSKTAQNYKDQEGYGFELEAEWQATDTLSLKANIAYQRSKDKDTDEIVPEAPELQFYANAHWAFLPDWSLDGQYFRIEGRHRDSAETREAVDDYDLVNLILRRKNISKNLEAAILVRNLFNEDVREPSPVPGVIPHDYPMEGRSIFGEVRLYF
jgi:iron complex outermembrane receptor protein